MEADYLDAELLEPYCAKKITALGDVDGYVLCEMRTSTLAKFEFSKARIATRRTILY